MTSVTYQVTVLTTLQKVEDKNRGRLSFQTNAYCGTGLLRYHNCNNLLIESTIYKPSVDILYSGHLLIADTFQECINLSQSLRR